MSTNRSAIRSAMGLLWVAMGLFTVSGTIVYGTDTGVTAGHQQQRPRIGLVLSGGGARGIAHIGVIRVLEEYRVPIDYIAGTSMGSIVGGAYASGMSVEEMIEFVTEVDWDEVFRDSPQRQALSLRRKQLDRNGMFGFELGYRDGQVLLPAGAIIGQQLDQAMDKLGRRADGINDFDDLPIPFRAIATDLASGQMVILEQGSLARAMRASMAVPGAVAPVQQDDRLLVDGGLVRNLPVDIAREMGADVIIAVNLGTPLLKRNELNSLLSVTFQMIGILTEQNVQKSLASLGQDDVLILPELGDISAASFGRAEEAIEIGIAAATEVLPQLQRYSLLRADYLVHRGRQRPKAIRTSPRVVDEIRIERVERVNPTVIKNALETQPGQELDRAKLNADVARLHGYGDFERVNYRLFEEAGRQIVSINAFEKSWGPNYLRFGLGLESDFQGITNFNLRNSFDMTWFNSLGAEWRNDVQIGQNSLIYSEFFQPLAVDSDFFVAPYLNLNDRIEDLFDRDRKVAEYSIVTLGAGFDVGKKFGNWGTLRMGMSAANIDSGINTGQNELPSFNVFQGAINGKFLVDTLDSAHFPTKGDLGTVQVRSSLEALGSDDEYTKVFGHWNRTFSFGMNRFGLGLKAGTSLEGDVPAYDEFTLGGFLNLSGYRPKQLRGQDLAFGRIVYHRPFWEMPRALGNNIYFGGSLEAGNVWEDFQDAEFRDINTGISAFLGADTIIGPFYLGYGDAGNRNRSFYIFIGNP